MSFAEEVKAGQPRQESAPATKITETALFDLPGTQPPPAASKDELPLGSDPVVKEAKIKIGDAEFSSAAEAIEYARTIDQARREDNAYIEGVKSGLKPEAPAAIEKDIDEQVEEILFEDPKKAVKKLRESIKQELTAEYKGVLQQRDQAVVQEQEAQKFWSEFRSEFKDLANHDTAIKYVYSQDPVALDALGRKDMKAAKLELAQRTRAMLRGYKESELPQKEMHSGPVNVATSNGTPGAAVAEATHIAKSMDFISQVNKMRKKGQSFCSGYLLTNSSRREANVYLDV